MRGQAAAMSILSSSSSSAASLFHRRVIATTCLRPSSSSPSRLFPLLSRCLSNWNNRSSPLRSVPAIKLQVAEIGGRRRWCSTRATNVSDPGSIDSSMILSMQTKIKDELEAESVLVKDAYGDGRHVTIMVVSKLFEGKTAVSRQRMVYKAIWEELQTTVHAVDHMTTLTPDESQSQSDPPNL